MEDVLRGPTPPPGVPVPFVGRDLEVEALAARLNRWSEPGTSDENPKAVVLHGPAGVGKSALAAALVERLGLRHAHWLSLGDRARAEPTLLRLLGEHRAPRRPVVEAALTADRTGDEREFARELRDQCQEHIQGSVLVLDGVHPTLGAELLEVLHQGTNLVIITSRQKARWADLGVYRHRVRPLSARDSVQLAQDVAAARWAGFSPNPSTAGWSRQHGGCRSGHESPAPCSPGWKEQRRSRSKGRASCSRSRRTCSTPPWRTCCCGSRRRRRAAHRSPLSRSRRSSPRTPIRRTYRTF
ncbi:ATP-binding protein [Streptomyces phaeochromogenes]|nr:ATP-binding protein [Streptomyces phaeochromogenes]